MDMARVVVERRLHLDREIEIEIDIDIDIPNTFGWRKEQWNWLKRISVGPGGISMSDFEPTYPQN